MAEVSEALLVGSYAGLLAVNAVAGSGLFGANTNGEISAAYPTEITPRGATFAIWGPIFLLQGGGTALLASGSAGGLVGPYGAAALPWVATWAFETAWQAAFWTAPIKEGASDFRKSLSLVPSGALLVGGHAAIVTAGKALKHAEGGRTLLGSLLVDLPTGLNAGWMAAASGIGLSLVAKHGPSFTQSLATPTGGAALIYSLSAYGAVTSVYLVAPHSILVSLGYSFASGWACHGIAERPVVAPKVKKAARRGVWIAAFGGLLSLAVANGMSLAMKK